MSFRPYEPCFSDSHGPQPGAVALMRALLIRFLYAYSLGIYADRDIRGGQSRSIHGCGRADDVGIPTLSNGRANTALGHPIVRLLIEHAWELGIMGIIYNRVRYDDDDPRGAYYGGVAPHWNHAHVELTEEAARTLTNERINEILGPIEGDQMLDRNSPRPSSAVAMFQRDLISLGYDLGDWPSIQPSLYPAGADGSFGNDAETATRAFQADMDIQATGVGDALTVALAANLARFAEHPRSTGGAIEAGGGGDHSDSDHSSLATKAALEAVSDTLDTHTADVQTDTPHS